MHRLAKYKQMAVTPKLEYRGAASWMMSLHEESFRKSNQISHDEESSSDSELMSSIPTQKLVLARESCLSGIFKHPTISRNGGFQSAFENQLDQRNSYRVPLVPVPV